MRPATAVRLGLLVDEADSLRHVLRTQGTAVNELTRIGVIAQLWGVSTNSEMITEACRTGELTSFDLGRFGRYVLASDVTRYSAFDSTGAAAA